MSVRYRLEPAPRVHAAGPDLDASQRSVVEHAGGPLLVLAGPGTGKTTTLVEAVVQRVEKQGLSPDEVLVLTFSRKAADELRTKITARLGRTSAMPMSSTFHSFCYALLRQHQPADLYLTPLRLLSAPEQDVRIQTLLEHSLEHSDIAWPEGLSAALHTRGFAREVHSVLSRARELSLEPEELVRIGRDADRPEWVAAGAFMTEYLEVLDFEAVLDYSELVHRAVLLAETDDVRAQLRRQFKAVYVDEYQDTDPAQVRLLQAIAGDGRDLVVVGDPDQSIYAFRGADVRGILEFPTQFPQVDGRPADVVALSTTRRFGERLLTASRRIAHRIGMKGSIDAETFRTFREPVASDGPYGKGKVDIYTFTSSGAETDHIADLLRRAHLEDDVPWSEMAVLVRSGVTSIPGLRRALVASGVPVEVAGDEVPLHREPAVLPLLTALRVAVEPESLTEDTARMLVMSPLADLDAAGVRKLGRELRARDRLAHPERLARSSGDLLRQALGDPSFLVDVEDRLAAGPRRLSRLLQDAHAVLERGGPAEEALWTLWAGTRWPRRLRGAVERGGAAARAAHRDLDAICALFEVAARAEEKRHHTSAENFLAEVEAQQIPADTLAERGVRGDSVRLLTAHRSKGLEWRIVVVAGVQEGSWPDLRRRGSLLQADRLGRDGLVEPPTTTAMLAEERRLFYVAVTRARQRLIVTAVQSPEADGDQPSRLVEELSLEPTHLPGRPARSMSLGGVVSELRRVASDPTESEPMRRAAAARLAALAAERIGDDELLVPASDPLNWWGLRRRTTNEVPVRPGDEPLRLSASTLEGLLTCPLKWFLSREAAGESARSTSLGFGSVIHALAEHMATDGSDEEGLVALLDSVWGQLQFDSPWIAEREHEVAVESLRRFLRWHDGRPERTYLGAEVQFSVALTLDDGEQIELGGRVDRAETDDEGRVVIVDFKTNKTPPPDSQVRDSPQLGIYQLAVDEGGFDELAGEGARSGGAELVQLRADKGGFPKVQPQEPQTPDSEGRKTIEVQLASGAHVVRREEFAAQANKLCARCEFQHLCPTQQRTGTVLS